MQQRWCVPPPSIPLPFSCSGSVGKLLSLAEHVRSWPITDGARGHLLRRGFIHIITPPLVL